MPGLRKGAWPATDFIHHGDLFRIAIDTVAESDGAPTRPSTPIRCLLSALAVMSILATPNGDCAGVSRVPDPSKYSKSKPVRAGSEL